VQMGRCSTFDPIAARGRFLYGRQSPGGREPSDLKHNFVLQANRVAAWARRVVCWLVGRALGQGGRHREDDRQATAGRLTTTVGVGERTMTGGEGAQVPREGTAATGRRNLLAEPLVKTVPPQRFNTPQ
jgi:hypothetical protein